MSPTILIIGLVLLVVIYVISIYNGLQTIKTRIIASIQEIGNQLKRQSNLIPNLQESAKAYLKHEKEIYSMLTAARTSVDKAVKDKSLASADKASAQIQNLAVRRHIEMRDYNSNTIFPRLYTIPVMRHIPHRVLADLNM